MRTKRMTVQWLLVTLVGLSMMLAGCGSSKDNGSAGGTEQQSGSSESGGSGASDLKPYEITIAYANLGNAKDLQEVQDAISKVTQAKINATVKLMPIDFAAWAQQTNLMLAGNEKLDIMMTMGSLNYSGQVAKGQLLPLDEMLDKYGQEVKKAIAPEILKATMIDGKTFGLPSIRDWAADFGVMMRKDLVDKYKIDTASIKSLDDLDAIFKIIKDNEPTVTPVVPYLQSTGVLSIFSTADFDTLGDTFGVLPDYDNGLKVVNMYEHPKYKAMVDIARRWYMAGYISKDVATNKNAASALIKADKAFAYIANMKPGYESKESRTAGKELVGVRLTKPLSSTTGVQTGMFSIVKNSQDPERAMMFLNLLYSDKELINLIDYGIENKHYVKKSDNVINYAPGVDAATSGYNPNHGWLFGNQFLSYIWEGDPEDLWEQTAAFNKSATFSKAMGFNFNVDPVKTEAAAAKTVVDQFAIGLMSGTLDPAEYLPKFNEKLKAAGLDKIIAEKQKQLDAWAASQNK
ncbi:ABC transporter substrate-binding protein [Paenibacillus guangzhouensis]|uniref:ABC transporter substrate-binding protein n=1 Tax=Paenibacillus guangzhouensis TaxID=1473112 RepID=UPI00187BBC72|nr:ABC transporter substrate-binding protein [Paenibacillus guangzhouensis]